MSLKDWARTIKLDVHALYLAARDPRTPWYAKALAVCVAGYALSPIDLIPDFIPVIGCLDDVILVPLGVFAVVKMIPPGVMRLTAAQFSALLEGLDWGRVHEARREDGGPIEARHPFDR
ncbi:MAG: DUF1232 domain-containing protein [Mesorhizobium sp.]